MKTSKNKQKTNSYNSWVVEQLSKRHGFTTRFIRQCLLGDRTSLTADTVKKQYKELDMEFKKTLDNLADTAIENIINKADKPIVK